MLKIDLDISPLKKEFLELNNSKISRIVNKAISKVVLEFKKDVLLYTPRGTGQLLNSWEVKKDNLTIEAGYNEIYAMYQEMGMREDGTHIIKNRPSGGKTFFMKETLEENTNKYLNMYEKIIFKELFL